MKKFFLLKCTFAVVVFVMLYWLCAYLYTYMQLKYSSTAMIGLWAIQSLSYAIAGTIMACHLISSPSQKSPQNFYRISYMIIAIISSLLAFAFDSFSSILIFGTNFTDAVADRLYLWPLIAGYSLICVFRYEGAKKQNWKYLGILLLVPAIAMCFEGILQVVSECILCFITGILLTYHAFGANECTPAKEKFQPLWLLIAGSVVTMTIGIALIVYAYYCYYFRFFPIVYLWLIASGSFLTQALFSAKRVYSKRTKGENA